MNRIFKLRLSGCSRSCLQSKLYWRAVVICILSLWTLPLNCHQWIKDKAEAGAHWLTHPIASQLCGHNFNGVEGARIKGFFLDRAFVVSTPGVTFRQEADSLLNQEGPSTHCNFQHYSKTHLSEKVRAYTETLRMKELVLKKGSKPGSAFKILKYVPEKSKCEENMLTPKGVVQNIQLGEYLALSYLNSLNSLSSESSRWLDLAHSVGNEVSYQSALALLYGVLGEKQFVYAGVGKLSKHFSDDKKSAPDTQEHLEYFIQKSFQGEHHLFKDNSSPTSVRQVIDRNFGEGVSAKEVLSSISLKHCDYSVEDSYKLPDHVIESVATVSHLHNRYLLNSSLFVNFSKSTTLPFRKFMKTWITMSLQQSKSVDFKLVAVNELFMLHLLASLEVESADHIPPVTRLVIERFQMEKSRSRSARTGRGGSKSVRSKPKSLLSLEHTYYRVLFNGKVITRDIWNCRSDPFASLGLCSFPTFVYGLESEEKVKSFSFKEGH